MVASVVVASVVVVVGASVVVVVGSSVVVVVGSSVVVVVGSSVVVVVGSSVVVVVGSSVVVEESSEDTSITFVPLVFSVSCSDIVVAGFLSSSCENRDFPRSKWNQQKTRPPRQIRPRQIRISGLAILRLRSVE